MLLPLPTKSFLALDFETSGYQRDAACALALVRVENLQIVERDYYLIKPKNPQIMFTHIHGITWEDLVDQPTFEEWWPEMSQKFENVDYLVAHNASFDRSVLNACCQTIGVDFPTQEFICTVKVARKVWSLKKANLPAVCEHLDIPLQHHYALSDAEACAQILIHALNPSQMPLSP